MTSPTNTRFRQFWLACLLLGLSTNIQAAVLDIDGDGIVTAPTDGQLVLRYLFGLHGNPLIDGVLGSEASRDASAIHEYLTGIDGSLDVDADGSSDALSDGLLILRYLFGYKDAALVTGMVSPVATRDAEGIAAYIDALVEDPPAYGQAPSRMALVQANSLTSESIQLDWLPTFDNDTPGSQILYVLHASQE